MSKVCLLILAQLALVACQVAIKLSSDAVPTFADEIKEPKYIVGALREGASVPPHSRSLPMTDANGTKYDCYIPLLDGQGTTTSSEVAQQALLPQQTPGELLDALKEWCAYRVEDWWTYEVCYKQHVRQYHKEQGKLVAEYLLGHYDEAESNLDEVQVDLSDLSGESKFVRQRYTAGGACELTGMPRTTEVRYTCGSGSGTSRHSEHVITSIVEPSSCTYIITIATPRLCKHPEFRSEPSPVAAIRCIPQPKAGEGREQAGGADASTAGSAAAVALPSAAEGQCSTPGPGATCASPGAAGAGGSGSDGSSGSGAGGSSSGVGGGSSSDGGSGSDGGAGGEGRPVEEPPRASPASNTSASAEEEWDDEGYEGLVEGEPRPGEEDGVDEGVWEEIDAARQEMARDDELDQGAAAPGGHEEL